MREIKFRVWDGWSMHDDGFYIYQDGIIYEHTDDTKECWCNDIDVAPGNYALMQYTGLKDKEGRKIYEGDILRFVDDHDKECGCDHCFPGMQKGDIVGVKWVDDGFMILPIDSYFNGEGDSESLCETCSAAGRLFTPNHEIPIGCYSKVIGNIYENKEFLGK